MSEVFVTGGSGFIGGRLIERLRLDGHAVRALARSSGAAERVRARGAEPVQGDLCDVTAMRAGADGSELAFHAAATLGDWGPAELFERGNVQGTANVLRACADAGVRRFVHVGTEAALLAGRALVDVDESAALRPDSPALYSSTKARAEQAVLAANRERFETVVVRPRFVWGVGDTTLLATMVELVRRGRFAWIGGGRHRTSTTNVDNAVEGLVLGAARGRPGNAYFVTDGEPVVVPRVRQQAARHAGGSATLTHDPRPPRPRARGHRRGNMEAAAPPRPPAADAPGLLAVGAGVHHSHRQGARAALLRTRQEHPRRDRRAARCSVTVVRTRTAAGRKGRC
jgi:nucleoside-diphosphate-sugar epimerase